jgi:RNA polymerase sigma-70 factor (ECF subfamily)
MPTEASTDETRSDEELIALLNQGDSEAFEIVYRRHRDWVATVALRITGDHALALDVLQETFLYFLRKFPGFTLRCQLRSFLYPAVRNLAIAARRQAARLQSDGGTFPEIAGSGHDNASAPDRIQLNRVVAALPEGQREVLLLRFADELSLQEIAEALDVPLGTVKSRLHNALGALREAPETKKFFDE